MKRPNCLGRFLGRYSILKLCILEILQIILKDAINSIKIVLYLRRIKKDIDLTRYIKGSL